MNAIICDKCEKIQKGRFSGAIVELNRLTIGSPREVHLCHACTEKFMDWLKGEDHDSAPENSR